MHMIERYHDFSCGHRVCNHESKCAHLHGHNYRVTFSVVPAPKRTGRSFIGRRAKDLELDHIGRVVDFSVVKTKLCQWLEDNWDHKFLIWEQDPQALNLRLLDQHGVVPVPFNPTAENMAQYLVEVVGPAQLAELDVMLVACKVEETRKCSATYTVGG
jgi:6-pyruvoyltetrahydropterin/6-carboxytetrahydropterin synthase